MASNQEHAKLILDALTTKNFGTDKMEDVLAAFTGLYAPDRDVEKFEDEARAAVFINHLREHIVGVVRAYRGPKAAEAARVAELAAVDAEYGSDVVGEPLPVEVKPGDIGPVKPGSIAEPIEGRG